MRPILSDIQNILATVSLAFATGFVFHMFGLPAPFLLGALFGIWITGAAIAPIRKRAWSSALASRTGDLRAWHSNW